MPRILVTPSAFPLRLTFLVTACLVLALRLSGDTLATEARTLVTLLQRIHYNHAAVQPADFATAIPRYMTELDPQRLFFLEEDEAFCMRTYAKGFYFKLSALGDLSPASEISDLYLKRVEQRVSWIMSALDKDIDFTLNDEIQVNRRDAPWPKNAKAADQIWSKRLKAELLTEILNDLELAEAKRLVRLRYQNLPKNVAGISRAVQIQRYLSTVAGLFDPISQYYSAEAYDELVDEMSPKLSGVRLELEIHDGDCYIVDVPEREANSSIANVQPGDRIVAIGRGNEPPTDVFGMHLSQIVRLLRQPNGTELQLVIQPPGSPDAARKTVTVTCRPPSAAFSHAYGSVHQVPNSTDGMLSIGVITLPSFYSASGENDSTTRISSSQKVASLIADLKKQKVDGIVLDLRDNGGGLLAEAIEIAGFFIGKSPVLQTRDYKGLVEVLHPQVADALYAGPTALLVNEASASASEIVAGAMQNYGRALVIGSGSTMGAGAVQTIIELGNFIPTSERTGAVKLTIQRFYLPNGSSPHINGITPDIVLPSYSRRSYLKTSLSAQPVPDMADPLAIKGQPMNPEVLSALRQKSKQRQQVLEEFRYLNAMIKLRKLQQADTLSLNLEFRRKQKYQIQEESNRLRTLLAGLTEPFTHQNLEKLERTTVAEKGLDVFLNESLRIFGDGIVQKAE